MVRYASNGANVNHSAHCDCMVVTPRASTHALVSTLDKNNPVAVPATNETVAAPK
jgi:hypothetical protein